MARRFASALASVLVATLLPAGALAQPARGKEKKPPAAAPPSEPAEKPKDGAGAPPADPANPGTAPAAAGAAPSAPVDDLGEPPPKRPPETAATKLSPLTPNADEFPRGPEPPAPAELDKLLGDILALRSRVAALTTTLYKSKLRVVIEAPANDSRVEAISVSLDDGVVFNAAERFSADDERVVYEHAVAPGQHVVGLDIERFDARGRQFRTWQSSRFALVVPEGGVLNVHVLLEDDSEMAADFPDDEDGEYDLRVRVRARVSE